MQTTDGLIVDRLTMDRRITLNYCHRVTADDGKIGEQHLRDFQDNAKTIPTILTTSQKLSTGVDARNVRHIVLMRPIRSMIEFKQIIGRGTRTYDGKDFFTIWDFVKAHENFNDPEWDGEPMDPVPPNPRPETPERPKPDPEDPPPDGPEDPRTEKIVVQLSDGKARTITYLSTTSYWGKDGKPISGAEFLKQLFGDLSSMIPDEDRLRTIWSDPDSRERLLGQLSDQGYDQARLKDIRQLVDAPDSDLFDVLSYVLYTITPKTRQMRADRVKETGLSATHGEMKQLLLAILNAYETGGESELASRKLTQFLTSRYGGVGEGKAILGGLPAIKDTFKRMQAGLYLD